jgi:flavoprotein
VPESGRIAWAITGSGHNLDECLDLGAEVLQAYGQPVKQLKERLRVFRDSATSWAVL